MRKKRKQRMLITKEQRQLVLNSTIIEKYPNLKVVLQKYENIHEDDLKNTRDFNNSVKNLILNVFKGIKEEAEKEWYRSGEFKVSKFPKREDWVRCSLCGTPNKYIFYIVNRFNKTKLNVGSECIEKFQYLNTKLPDGTTMKELKKKKIRDLEKLKRLEEFNIKFPNAQQMLAKWIREYNNLPIIIPMDLHRKITDIHQEASKIFKDYVSRGKIDGSFDTFEYLINERKELLRQAKEFINKNQNEKFICTKEIYDWILKQNRGDTNNIVKNIRNNSSKLPDNIIPLIYEKSFFNDNLVYFINMLKDTRVSIIDVKDNIVYLEFKDIKRRVKSKLYLTKKDFMRYYGDKLTIRNPKIAEEDILKKANIVLNEENCAALEFEIEKALKGTEYEIKLDYESLINGLEFINKEEKTYANGLKTEIFLNAQKDVILLKGEGAKRHICNIISRINNWRPLSDKEKFAIGDISKKSRDEDFDFDEELAEA